MADLDGIDFIDFGASNGSSLRWAQDTFKKVGLGIDLDPAKIEKTRALGFKAMQADAGDLQLPDNAVSFAVVSDFLEHLGMPDVAEKVIDSAIRVARDFVYIAYPDFDNEAKLIDLGFKRYYADWSGHNLHLGGLRFAKMVAKHGYPYSVFKLQEIFDSWDRNVLPLSALRNQSFYDIGQHGPKEFVVFPRKNFFARNVCIVIKNPEYSIDALMVKVLYSIGYMRRLAGSDERSAPAAGAATPAAAASLPEASATVPADTVPADSAATTPPSNEPSPPPSSPRRRGRPPGSSRSKHHAP